MLSPRGCGGSPFPQCFYARYAYLLLTVVTPACCVVLDRGLRLTGPRRLGGSGYSSPGSTRYPGAPIPLCSYITRGMEVVDRTRGVCPVTCCSKHLTSHLFHSYISTTHSLRPQGLCILFPVCSLSVQATSLGF